MNYRDPYLKSSYNSAQHIVFAMFSLNRGKIFFKKINFTIGNQSILRMSLLYGQNSKLCTTKEETENKPKHGRQAETEQRYFSKTKENKYNNRIKIFK